LGSTLALKTFV